MHNLSTIKNLAKSGTDATLIFSGSKISGYNPRARELFNIVGIENTSDLDSHLVGFLFDDSDQGHKLEYILRELSIYQTKKYYPIIHIPSKGSKLIELIVIPLA